MQNTNIQVENLIESLFIFFNFLLERLNKEDKAILSTDQKPVGKTSKKTSQKISSYQELIIPTEYEEREDKYGKYSAPWREYECTDGNHKLIEFEK